MHPVLATRRGRSPQLSVTAVIPARYESTRFPGKALAPLAGRPMIEHVYRRTSEAPSIETVLVATDDDRIEAAVRRFGGRVCRTRTSHRSGTDRIAEVAETLSCDLIVNVQGDEPLIEPDMIEEALDPFFEDPAVAMTTLRRPIDDARDLDDPNVVKVVADLHGNALYFSRARIPSATHGGAAAVYRHVGLYVYRRDFLLTFARWAPTPLETAESLEQLRALEHGRAIRTVVTRFESIGVDTPEDLERVRRLLEAGAEV